MIGINYPSYPGGVNVSQIIGLTERGYDRAVDQRNEEEAKKLLGEYASSLYGGAQPAQTSLGGLNTLFQPQAATAAPSGTVTRSPLPAPTDYASQRVAQAFGDAGAPAVAGQSAAQSSQPLNSNAIAGRFLKTVRDGGVTNPYALAAIAATGKAESGFDPANATRTWSDPSQSGQAGMAGGIMSWRGPRLAAMQAFAQQQGDDPNAPSPETQAKFLLAEDPSLIAKLQQAKSPEEAQALMNNAWKFAGYNQQGGETAERMASANAYAQQFGGTPSQQALEGLAVGGSVPMGAAPSGQGVQVTDASGAMPSMPAQADPSSLLPPREVMAGLFANPVTRPMAIQLAQSVQKMRAGNADPQSQVEYQIALEKLRQLRDPQSKLVNAGGGNIYDPNTKTWITPPEGASANAGLTPVLMRDEEGNLFYGQTTKDGKIIRSSVPEGAQPVSPYDKKLQESRGTAEGKAGGEANAGLPQVETNAATITSMIDSLANDPYLDSMLGPVNSRKPNFSSDAERVQSKMNQIGGQAFLQAFNMLRGGGQITEVEGQKATEAMARLNTAQSPADYRAALNDLKAIVQTGVDRARRQAGQGGSQPAAPTGNRTSSGVQWSIEE